MWRFMVFVICALYFVNAAPQAPAAEQPQPVINWIDNIYKFGLN